MSVITNTNVYNFLGLKADQKITHSTLITTLISNSIVEFEQFTGRKIEATTFTDVLFEDGLNCEIIGEYLWFSNNYRDTYSISSITENGVALTAATAYNDSGDYHYNASKGYIKRIDAAWSTETLAIKMSGGYGLVLANDTSTTLLSIQQCIIEMVAAKSGLWKINTITEDGSITQIKTTISKEAKEVMNRYRLRSI